MKGHSIATSAAAPLSTTSVAGGVLQRACDCGQHTVGGGECAECKKKKKQSLQRQADGPGHPDVAPPIVHDVLRSQGKPLDAGTRGYFEPRFGADFSRIRVHDDARASESARAVRARAYTVGQQIVFANRQYSPGTTEGRRLLAHELAHSRQQDSPSARTVGSEISVSEDRAAESNADSVADATISGGAVRSEPGAGALLQRRAGPYIKKITVHLAPKQKAELAWHGSPPSDAPGSDSFQVSTGKGYSDPGDPDGTCIRDCCGDADKQCAPPWNQPGKVGACCTYFGDNFWTGTPLDEHNGWKWWTPIQPYYSSRGIALHQHDEVTGDPIGHGCVRMDEPNAKRIHDFSNGEKTNVTIDGRAAPVKCDDERKCKTSSSGTGGSGAQGESADGGQKEAHAAREPIPGMEGAMS